MILLYTRTEILGGFVHAHAPPRRSTSTRPLRRRRAGWAPTEKVDARANGEMRGEFCRGRTCQIKIPLQTRGADKTESEVGRCGRADKTESHFELEARADKTEPDFRPADKTESIFSKADKTEFVPFFYTSLSYF